MPELDMKKAEAFCERMVENGGICQYEACAHCPGYGREVDCVSSGWVSKGGTTDTPNAQLVESCKRWLKENAKKENTVLEFEGMSYEEAQTLKRGDRVKVLMKYPGGSYCPRSGKQWDNSWGSEMDDYVGESFFVFEVDPIGVLLIHEGEPVWQFPWFALKLIERMVKKVTMAEVEEKFGGRVEIVSELEG